MPNKLNIGSGKDYHEGAEWVNLEINQAFKADVYCDMLQYQPEITFSEVLAKDVLTHVSYRDCLAMIRRIYTWLEPNGLLYVHLPNFETCAKRAINGDHEAMTWIYGSDGTKASYATNWIHWGYTPESMRRILEDAGFTILDIVSDCKGLAFGVKAVKR